MTLQNQYIPKKLSKLIVCIGGPKQTADPKEHIAKCGGRTNSLGNLTELGAVVGAQYGSCEQALGSTIRHTSLWLNGSTVKNTLKLKTGQVFKNKPLI